MSGRVNGLPPFPPGLPFRLRLCRLRYYGIAWITVHVDLTPVLRIVAVSTAPHNKATGPDPHRCNQPATNTAIKLEQSDSAASTMVH